MTQLPAEFIIEQPVKNKMAHYKRNVYGDYTVKIVEGNKEEVKVKSILRCIEDYNFCSVFDMDYYIRTINE
jgi:hypothetical protein